MLVVSHWMLFLGLLFCFRSSTLCEFPHGCLFAIFPRYSCPTVSLILYYPCFDDCRNMCIIGFISGTLYLIRMRWLLSCGLVLAFADFIFICINNSYGWYFTFVQGFVYLMLLYLQGFTTKHMVNPWKTYVKLSAVLMGSHGLTKGSLAFLNYPAQIMFKSTKVGE